MMFALLVVGALFTACDKSNGGEAKVVITSEGEIKVGKYATDVTIHYDIVGVEDVQWARKGIIVFLAKDGRRVKLDAWHHAGVEELVAKVLPSKSNENKTQEN